MDPRQDWQSLVVRRPLVLVLVVERAMDREPDQRCGDVTPSRAIHELAGTDSNDGSRCLDRVHHGGSASGRRAARTDSKLERCYVDGERTTSPKDHPDDTTRKVPHHS